MAGLNKNTPNYDHINIKMNITCATENNEPTEANCIPS